MPAKQSRPQAKQGVVPHMAGTPEANERMTEQLADAAARAEPVPRSRRVVDLVVGDNRIITNLGRRAFGVNLSPTVASSLFAWSFAADGDRYGVITVIGADQPACPVEFY